MGGSSGVFKGRGRSPEEVAEKLKAAADASASVFEPVLAKTLGELLIGYNERDTDSVRERLEEVKVSLGGAFNCSIDTLFGGSVAKRTYVDGISDVDSLVIFSEGQDLPPQGVLFKIKDVLLDKIGDDAVIDVGTMAVTITYREGPELQLIPAISVGGDIKIPSSDGGAWSEINPVGFSKALVRRNEECHGKLVPTIKLAKAVNANLPESLRLSGYHIESLAVAAFRDYAGPKTTSVMLPLFFEKASDLVLRPVADKTNQSVHVDEYLGVAESDKRRSVSHALTRLHKRMVNASAAHSRDRWLDLFGEE
jgi:hypothetical protein